MAKVKVSKKELEKTKKKKPTTKKKVKKTSTTKTKKIVKQTSTLVKTNNLPSTPKKTESKYEIIKKKCISAYLKLVKNIKSKIDKIIKHIKKIKRKPKKVKKQKTIEVKKQIVSIEPIEEVKRKRFLPKPVGIVLYFFVVLCLGIGVGYIPFMGVEDEVVAETGQHLNCRYTEWVETEVNYCLVNSEGKAYEGEYVKYSLDASEGMCKKYTRTRICS